jgi:hypothetical protein
MNHYNPHLHLNNIEYLFQSKYEYLSNFFLIYVNRSLKKENNSRKSRTNLLHKESTKNTAFLTKIGVDTKPRLTSNTSGSFSNSFTDFRLDKSDKTVFIHECQYIHPVTNVSI